MSHLLKPSSVYELLPLDRLSGRSSTLLTDRTSTLTKNSATESHKLRNRGHVALVQTNFALLILFTCVPFLVFGGLVSQHHGHATSEHPKLKSGLIQASKIGPSLFAPLFAAVAGRTILKFVQWRAERGTNVGSLDQLLGCTTMFGAISTQVELKALNWIAVCLVALWALSPLGGQASTRILDFGLANSTIPSTIDYLDMNNTFDYYTGGDKAGPVANAGAVFISALSSSLDVKNSGQDVWGNVKIPMLERLPLPSKPDPEGWVNVPANGSVYSSLAGIPVSLRDRTSNISFVIYTSYWVLDCPELRPVAENENTTSVFANAEPFPNSPWWLASPNTTDSSRYTFSKRSVADRYIAYQSWDSSDNESYATCTLQTSFVEASVWCTDGDCRVTTMRPSKLLHPPPSWSTLDYQSRTFDDFAYGLTGSILGHEAHPTPIQGYFLDPGQPFSNNALEDKKGLYQLSKESFETSLAQIMNTYWIVAIAPTAVPAGRIQPDLNSTLHQMGASSLPATNVTIVTTYEIFVCNNTWLAILLLVDLILFIFGTIGLVLAMLNKGPSLALNMSYMVRDSPYVLTEPSSSLCSGAERSRALKNVRVRYGDVLPEEKLGKVGIGECDEQMGLWVGVFDGRREYA
ncbi:hypothetical protein NA57DRAFT_74748 [Rhizodiscina lignyota]|uniref:Uncharacterized protein n=1 Tax=Rhizodiscina lignyota TaxID=1504668 RepID=A0A9P4IHF3_9PEZI|nr:hypothetical protein NA57DRAFT_74748 [Rhizodiscina lignyota]